MKPIRIQLSRRKGWRMPENTAKVDRSSFYGNPFVVYPAKTTLGGVWKQGFIVNGFETTFFDDRSEAAALSVKAFRAWVQSPANAKYAAAVPLLRGKNLACWCKLGTPCHADVLLEIANREDTP